MACMETDGTKSRRWRGPFRLVASLVLVSGTAIGGASAQSNDGNLAVEVQRLQRDLTSLKIQLFQASDGAIGGSASGGAPTAIAGPNETPATARLALRVTDLETSMKEITGRLEQIVFAIDQMNNRLTKLDGEVKAMPRRLPADTQATGDAQVLGRLEVPPGYEVRGVARDTPKARAAPSPAAVAQAGGELAAVNPSEVLPEGGPQEQYSYAMSLLRQGDYATAEQALRGFLMLHETHDLSSNAQYWLGETYYVRGDYVRAAQEFSQNYQSAPSGPKAADSLLKLGMSLAGLGDTSAACTTYNELSRQFPDAPGNIQLHAARKRKEAGC